MPPLLRRLLAALPDMVIAVTYALAVVDPAIRNGPTGTLLWRGAVMEFFAVHASGFLMWTWVAPEWSPARRSGFVAGLAGTYTLVLGIVSLVVKSGWPLATFWALTGNRILDAALRGPPTGSGMREEAEPWAGNVVLFTVCAAAVGIVGAARLSILVAGAAYFALNALSEAGGWWWVRRWLASRGR